MIRPCVFIWYISVSGLALCMYVHIFAYICECLYIYVLGNFDSGIGLSPHGAKPLLESPVSYVGPRD